MLAAKERSLSKATLFGAPLICPDRTATQRIGQQRLRFNVSCNGPRKPECFLARCGSSAVSHTVKIQKREASAAGRMQSTREGRGRFFFCFSVSCANTFCLGGANTTSLPRVAVLRLSFPSDFLIELRNTTIGLTANGSALRSIRP